MYTQQCRVFHSNVRTLIEDVGIRGTEAWLGSKGECHPTNTNVSFDFGKLLNLFSVSWCDIPGSLTPINIIFIQHNSLKIIGMSCNIVPVHDIWSPIFL